MSRVLNWDGKNLPEEMLSLPPGRYVVDAVEEAFVLTPAEEQGIRLAMDSLEAGQGSSLEEVRDRVLRSLLR